MDFTSIVTHLGSCPPPSFCLPDLRFVVTPSLVRKPCLLGPQGKKRGTSAQKGYPAARLQLKGESDSVPSTTKLNPFCRGECEGARVQVFLGFCAGPGT